MARARKRYDIYGQPGLFDFEPASRQESDEPWEPGKVLINGGDFVPEKGADADPLPPMGEAPAAALRFMSIGSGSSGNCAYLGNARSGILIDAGVENRKIEEALQRHGISMFQITGIILTHDHHDHVSHVYNILRNNRHMALFATPRTFQGILRRHSISRRVKDYHHPIYKETPFNIKDFTITPFEVSHDGTDNVGYHIAFGGIRFVVGTDMGVIGERADHYMRRATALMIESDYDSEMLRTGRYPEYLKARIFAEKGHLSNDQVAEFLKSAWNREMKHVFLCHLSKDNNTPQLAASSASEALKHAGAEAVGDASETITSRAAPVQVYALPRFDPSPLFFIR